MDLTELRHYVRSPAICSYLMLTRLLYLIVVLVVILQLQLTKVLLILVDYARFVLTLVVIHLN